VYLRKALTSLTFGKAQEARITGDTAVERRCLKAVSWVGTRDQCHGVGGVKCPNRSNAQNAHNHDRLGFHPNFSRLSGPRTDAAGGNPLVEELETTT
jgi:hypothetical protein